MNKEQILMNTLRSFCKYLPRSVKKGKITAKQASQIIQNIINDLKTI
jgi:polyhydroxyalkanoate synthesis regulator phasin